MTIPAVPCVCFYLLASSLTLSISAINDTSLSTMLKKEKKKEKNHNSTHAIKTIITQRLQTLVMGCFEINKTWKMEAEETARQIEYNKLAIISVC